MTDRTTNSSRTITQVEPNRILRLRPSEQTNEKVQQSDDKTKTKSKKKDKSIVRWTEDVVDNEHMNKKKSKICCIFHPQKSFDEEGQEEEHHHDHDSSSDESSDSSDEESNNNVARKPNAYEYQPQYENKSKLPQ